VKKYDLASKLRFYHRSRSRRTTRGCTAASRPVLGNLAGFRVDGVLIMTQRTLDARLDARARSAASHLERGDAFFGTGFARRRAAVKLVVARVGCQGGERGRTN